jgi:transglutaminase-like putative cysteine protease
MNLRLTVTAAIAVILSSFSLLAVIQGVGWLFAGMGAVLAVAAAGTLTRLAPGPAAAAVTVIALVAVVPLVTSANWLAIIGGAAVVAVAAASATRLRAFRVLAIPIAYLGALLIYLNLIFAPGQSVAGFVPTAASLRHLHYLVLVGQQASHHSAPVPAYGAGLLAAAGVGIVAAAVDLIAVRLRSPAIAGLPLLVLFSVPVTTNAKESALAETVAFCLGITGFLAMLAADGRERLRVWGRVVTVWHGSTADEPGRGPDTTALSASGRRIGLAAVCLAVLVPLLLPSLRSHPLFARGHGLGTGGHDLVALPQPLAEMQRQLTQPKTQPVLTYRTSNGQSQYLQIFVLSFDPYQQKWTLVPPDAKFYHQVSGRGLLPTAPGIVASSPVQAIRTQVTLGRVAGYRGKVNFLPLPYSPASLRAQGSWREDDATSMVYSTGTPLYGLRFSATSLVPDPSSAWLARANAGLPPGNAAQYFGYTGPHRRALLRLARFHTKGAKTAGERAYDLQNWFLNSGLFSYSTSVKIPNSDTGLYDFLTKERIGDCQQFAFAYAILARLLGIPSRVVIGFTGGIRQRDGDWLVTTADAHAWPEVFLAGAGWLRFEPTPGGAIGQGTAIPPSYATNAPPSSTSLPGSGSTPGSLRPGGASGSHPGAGPRFKHPNAAGGAVGGGRGSHRAGGSAFPYALAAAVLIALAALGPLLSRTFLRWQRWRTAHGEAGLARAAWSELTDDLTDLGLGARPSESPRTVADRVGADQQLPEQARAALRRVAAAEERARYATEPAPGAGLRSDVTLVRRALAQRASGRTRWRARLMPASMTEPVRTGLRQLLDVFGWLDTARLRRSRDRGGEFAR